jgi:hypothetical protein
MTVAFRRFLILTALAAIASFGARTAQAGGNYYIDCAGGNDNNNGTSTASPWKHHPNMVGSPYSGAGIAAYAQGSSDKFYFKGGVSCPGSMFPISTGGSGVAGNVYYIGPDPNHSWFAGASWKRPIIDGQGTVTGGTGTQHNTYFNMSGSYSTVDNFEIINYSSDNAHTSFGQNTIWATGYPGGDYDTFSNNYIHNFALPVGQSSSPALIGGDDIGHTALIGNIVDGSDNCATTPCGSMVEFTHGNCCNIARYNVVHDVSTFLNTNGGFPPGGDMEYAYNTFYNIGLTAAEAPFALHPSHVPSLCGPNGNSYCDANAVNGTHQDSIQIVSNSFGQAFIHDNLGEDFTAEGIDSGTSAATIYNNVLLHSWTTVLHLAPPNTTVKAFNNTIQCDGADGTTTLCWQYQQSNPGTVYTANNLFITSTGAAGSGVCMAAGGFSGCSAPTTFKECAGVTGGSNGSACDKSLSTAAATAAGMTQRQFPYVFAPISSGAPTVGTGTNLTGLISSTMLLGTETAYGAAYDSATQTVLTSLGRILNNRPNSGSWDVGAYQFSSVGSVSVQPPSGLSAGLQ